MAALMWVAKVNHGSRMNNCKTSLVSTLDKFINLVSNTFIDKRKIQRFDRDLELAKDSMNNTDLLGELSHFL